MTLKLNTSIVSNKAVVESVRSHFDLLNEAVAMTEFLPARTMQVSADDSVLRMMEPSKSKAP